MASAIKSGALVCLEDLVPSSPFFADRSSLRVIGKHGLQEYSVQTALAVIVDGRAKLKVNAVHLMDLSLREGSIYQFIGELSIIQPENEPVKQFQAEYMGNQMVQRKCRRKPTIVSSFCKKKKLAAIVAGGSWHLQTTMSCILRGSIEAPS
ncbi:hypothetical protein SAY87_029353 [Trapa incisa]|uniref:CST complex subunit TEN1 n=1 Tax=Trapa incisa TaxID=236973 RepID=A0AAN7K7K2_9MYRT|nr:hypothetical protein SAY87_029353 [Trapa incisa]